MLAKNIQLSFICRYKAIQYSSVNIFADNLSVKFKSS